MRQHSHRDDKAPLPMGSRQMVVNEPRMGESSDELLVELVRKAVLSEPVERVVLKPLKTPEISWRLRHGTLTWPEQNVVVAIQSLSKAHLESDVCVPGSDVEE